MSTTTTTTYPTTTTYTWSRAHLGGDTISIAAEDVAGCHAPYDGHCYYYIGVYGYANSTFTIVASYTDAEPVQLTIGQPQAGHVSQQTYAQFQVVVPANSGDDLQV